MGTPVTPHCDEWGPFDDPKQYVYVLEIVIYRAAKPFRVTGIRDEARVKEIIESFLAAWGIPVPRPVWDNGLSTFAERLLDVGVFSHSERDNYEIVVKRAE